MIGATEREARAATVESFYEKSPFPGYAPADDVGSLLDRSRRSGFLNALDKAIPTDGRVLDCGCGTGQLAAFLALTATRRQVFGIDGCLQSLTLAEEFRERTGTTNLQFVRGDLFDLPVTAGSFEIVISRGVVHHTPRPYEAIAKVAGCVAPGGVLVLGFYETRARLFHCARRLLSRVTRRPIRLLDPILRRRDLDAEKKRIWIEDQYHHPEEHILPLPRVVATLDGLGFDWVTTIPPMPIGATMFERAVRPSGFEMALRRTGMMFAGLHDPDAGLICYVARRRPTGT